jgi:hypothetical protein
LGRVWLAALVLLTVVVAAIAAACVGSDGAAALSVRWVREGAGSEPVAPSDSVHSMLVVHNEGGKDLESVRLRFNQNELGGLPYGVSVGTVTNASSDFEGDSQVWDLGRLEAGDSVSFPVTLWFESASRIAEPFTVRLEMVAASPGLQAEVESNPFEVVIDSKQAVRP